jgi:hypothetical protein
LQQAENLNDNVLFGVKNAFNFCEAVYLKKYETFLMRPRLSQ